MTNLLERAANLTHVGETGHVGNGERAAWEAWAVDVRRTLDAISARIEEITEYFVLGKVPGGKDFTEALTPYTASRERLRDAFSARDAASLAWPTWGGIDHELARFDSRDLAF